ncbi:hypothetical protein BDV11DRAFT_187929 [Aspergillus similis]
MNVVAGTVPSGWSFWEGAGALLGGSCLPCLATDTTGVIAGRVYTPPVSDKLLSPLLSTIDIGRKVLTGTYSE